MSLYLTQGLHRAIQRTPNKMATICGTRRRTYAELGDRVARLAGALQMLGMKTEDRIGMLAMNSDRYLEYFLGVWWGGGAVNAANTRWSAAEIAYSLDDSDTRVLIIDDNFVPMADELRRQSKSLQTLIYAGDQETPKGMLSFEGLVTEATPVPDAHRSGDDLAGVYYTGGTTGFPKGVMLTHTNLSTTGMSLLAHGLAPDDMVGLHAAPMFHLADGAMTLMVMLRGGTHVFVPSFAPELVLRTIQDEGVTTAVLVPVMIQMMVDHPSAADFKLDQLQRVLYGASPISEALLERAMLKLSGVRFTQCYGMTELAALGTVLTDDYHTPEGRKLGKLRSAGRATFHAEVRIVDAEGVEVPRGTVGEIAIRGAGVMKGYWGKPEQTAAALKDGWMHSGDGGYMDEEGFVFIVDRIKDMIVTGGENVYSAEVENAIAQHPAVAQCAVIGIPSDQWGEAVHAVIVTKPGEQVTAEEIKEHCKQRIANYKCPRSAEIRDSLPVSGAGKILKNKLREPFWTGRDRQVA